MAPFASKDIAFLLLGPYDLTDVATGFETETALPVVPTTAFGMAAAQYSQPGVKDYNLQGHAGFYDDRATSVNAALVALAAGSNIFMFGYEGNTVGKRVISAAGVLKAKFTRQLTVGDFTKANAELGVSGVVDDALLVAPYTPRTTAADTSATYLDLGAAVAATVSVISVANPTSVTFSAPHGFVSGQTVLFAGTNSTPALTGPYTVTVTDSTHVTVPVNVTNAGSAGTGTMTPGAAAGNIYLSCPVLTLGGYTNLTVSVQDSADHITFTDDTVFTALTAVGAESKTTGTLLRYICMKWVWTGAGSNQTATFAVSLKPNP
jgi:hypothetical protein